MTIKGIDFGVGGNPVTTVEGILHFGGIGVKMQNGVHQCIMSK